MTSSTPSTADTAATFRELGVSPAASRALEARGYERPLPVQAMVLPDVLEGRDVLAKSPTGSGKTLAFMVPLLDTLDANEAPRPAALILAPTRELASQIVEESSEIAHALALRVCAVYGGVGLQKQAREAARAHVIVATPGRLEDLLQRGAFSLDKIEILVLDEADRMLDMGFKPAIDRIVAQVPEDRQTLFFSATLDGEAGKIAAAYTVDAARHEHAPPQRPITEMDHRFIDTEGGDKVDLLLDLLEGEERGLAIVFVRTKHGADRLSKRLDREGVNAGAMHGGKTQGQRERALSAFERGKIDVLVATDVAARGIDIDDITHVINYDIPEDRETYVHRIGRTGRAGRTGTGMTLVTPEQEGEMAEIARDLGLADRFAEGGLDAQARATGKKKKGGQRGGGGGGPRGGGGQRPAARHGQHRRPDDRPRREWSDNRGDDRQARGGDRPYGDRPRRDNDRPYGDRPRRDNDRPYAGGDRPRSNDDRPNRGGDRPHNGERSHAGDRPRGRWNDDRSGRTGGGDRPYNGDRPRGGGGGGGGGDQRRGRPESGRSNNGYGGAPQRGRSSRPR